MGFPDGGSEPPTYPTSSARGHKMIHGRAMFCTNWNIHIQMNEQSLKDSKYTSKDCYKDNNHLSY